MIRVVLESIIQGFKEAYMYYIWRSLYIYIYIFCYCIGTPWVFVIYSFSITLTDLVSFIKIYMLIFLTTLFVVGEKWCNEISLWRWTTFGRGFEEDISLWSSMALPFFNRWNWIFLVPKSKMVQHVHYISIMKSLKEIYYKRIINKT